MPRRAITEANVLEDVTDACAGVLTLVTSMPAEGGASAWYRGVLTAMDRELDRWRELLANAGAPALPEPVDRGVRTDAVETELMGIYPDPLGHGSPGVMTPEDLEQHATAQGHALAHWIGEHAGDQARERMEDVVEAFTDIVTRAREFQRRMRRGASEAQRQIGSWLDIWRRAAEQTRRDMNSFIRSGFGGAGFAIGLGLVALYAARKYL